MMAHKIGNLIKQTSASTGSTTIALTGSPSYPYRAFSSLLSNGDTTEAVVVNRDNGQWQAAVYSFNADVLTLDPDHFFASSTGSPIDFAGGLKDVYIGPIAERDRPFLRSADFNALPFEYAVDTTDDEVVATLLADPGEGDRFLFNDRLGTWRTSNFIVEGNGVQFDDGTGVLKDRIVCRDPARFAVIYADSIYRVR